MSGLAVLFIVLLIIFAILTGLFFSFVGLILYLIVAAIVGWVADAIMPGDLPFGWLGALAAGLIGTFVGSLILGPIGPTIAGVPIISAIIGAIIVVAIFELLFHSAASPTPPQP